jgi:hypothetical protein
VANIGVAIPDMEQVTGRDLANCLQDCPIIPVLRLDPNSLTNRESRPAYLITNLSITQLLSDKGLLPTKQDFRIKIMDFGRGMSQSCIQVCNIRLLITVLPQPSGPTSTPRTSRDAAPATISHPRSAYIVCLEERLERCGAWKPISGQSHASYVSSS